jgi:hypothetical protein
MNVGTPTRRQKQQAWRTPFAFALCDARSLQISFDASDLDMLMDPELDEWFDIRFLSIRLAAAAAAAAYGLSRFAL